MSSRLPLLLEPRHLLPALADKSLLIVDLGKSETYARGHIAGAVHLDHRRLLGGGNPAPGKLPDLRQISSALSAIGLDNNMHVVAYDDEGGGWASRLLWTLDVVGHPHSSLLNGGIIAWENEGYPLSTHIPARRPTDYVAVNAGYALATRDQVMTSLDDPTVVLLDARSPEEYDGSKIRAAKRGHIPGAANLNWTDTMDNTRNKRLLPDAELRHMLAERNIDIEQEVIVYCHTHHRSSHSYIMLKHLGFEKIRGYAGSWSEWGNDPTTPVAL